MNKINSQPKTEQRPVTFFAMFGVAAASVAINVAGAFLLIPAPWNIPVTAAIFFIEVGAFLALPHIVKDFMSDDSIIAKIKAGFSFLVFIAMCVICAFSGNRALSEVGNQMSHVGSVLDMQSAVATAEAAALKEQASSWKKSAAQMRDRGMVTKAAALEERALTANVEAIAKEQNGKELQTQSKATPTLGHNQIWFILIVLEIVKGAGRFLFAMPMGSMRRTVENILSDDFEMPVLEEPQEVTKGYRPKKVALSTPVDPTAILKALGRTGDKDAIAHGKALFQASGGRAIFGVYDPNAGWAN